MRADWTAIFAGVAELTVELVRSVDGHDGWTWTEWIWAGTCNDGQAFAFRGVCLFEIRDELIVAGKCTWSPSRWPGGRGSSRPCGGRPVSYRSSSRTTNREVPGAEVGVIRASPPTPAY